MGQMSKAMAVGIGGFWYNQLGSTVELQVDGEGRLTGTMRSAVGAVDDPHSITGFYVAASQGGGGVVGFAVAWHPTQSVTVWSGHFRPEDDAIAATWLLTGGPFSHSEWLSTIVGHDMFRRFPHSDELVEWAASSIPDKMHESGWRFP